MDVVKVFEELGNVVWKLVVGDAAECFFDQIFRKAERDYLIYFLALFSHTMLHTSSHKLIHNRLYHGRDSQMDHSLMSHNIIKSFHSKKLGKTTQIMSTLTPSISNLLDHVSSLIRIVDPTVGDHICRFSLGTVCRIQRCFTQDRCLSQTYQANPVSSLPAPPHDPCGAEHAW